MTQTNPIVDKLQAQFSGAVQAASEFRGECDRHRPVGPTAGGGALRCVTTWASIISPI